MADAYLVKQGAAGSGSDECTANRKHVLAPYTAITGDSGDDPTTGTMLDQSGWKKTLAAGESVTVPGGYHDGKGTVTAKDLASQTSGTAADSDIRKGETAVVNGKTITGTQEDRGAWSSTGLLAGQSVTIPAGIHNGSGKITTASLASQTAGATAEDKYVKKGLKYWKDGVLRTGTMETQSAILFSVAALSSTAIRISWTNPTQGPWEGVRIRMSTSGAPGVSGGIEKYRGAGSNPNQSGGNNHVDITGLDPNQTYYFTCTNYYTGLDDGNSVNIQGKTKPKSIETLWKEYNYPSCETTFKSNSSGANSYDCYNHKWTPSGDRLTGGNSFAMNHFSLGLNEMLLVMLYEYRPKSSFSTVTMSDEDIRSFVGRGVRILKSTDETKLDLGKILTAKLEEDSSYGSSGNSKHWIFLRFTVSTPLVIDGTTPSIPDGGCIEFY